jgi:hypothetical protein
MSHASEQEEPNPYATSAISIPDCTATLIEDREYSLGKSVLIWAITCSISAAPSFFIAVGIVGVQNIPWLAIGVMIFIVGYVTADRMTFRWRFRRRVAVKLSLRMTYVVRIVASVIFPVALYADMICGIFSATFITALGFNPDRTSNMSAMPGSVVLLWTLIQGAVLNAVLSLIWIILLGICWVVTNEPTQIEDD